MFHNAMANHMKITLVNNKIKTKANVVKVHFGIPVYHLYVFFNLCFIFPSFSYLAFMFIPTLAYLHCIS